MERSAVKPVLRLVVRFCDKKFMVLIPRNALFKDVKSEILRVYKGICPSLADRDDLCISELRDYYGCIMFDEYEVGLLVRDLTKIVALRPGEEDSHSPSCCTPVPGRSFTPLLKVRSPVPPVQPNNQEHQLLSVASPTLTKVCNTSSLCVTGSQGSVLTNSNLPPHPSFLSHLSTPVLNHLDSTLSKSPEHLDDSPARQSDTNSKVTGYLSHSEEDVVKDLASQVTEPSSTGTHQDNVSLSKICEALCLKMVGERSGFQSAGHPDDRQVRQSATKSPAKAHPHLSTAGSAVQHSDPQIIESCKPENNTVGKPSCIVKDSLKQGYNKEKVKKSSADTSQVGKKSVPHKSLTEGSKAKRKRSVYSYSSSEEEGGTPLNTLAKIKRKRTSQPRRKKENAEKQSKRASEVSVGDKMPRRSKRISKRSTVDNKKPKVIEECASTLKAKAEVHYPGYSSEWSSAESESASKNGSTVATRAVKVKRQTDDQDSAQKSIVSTSSWTSSERNKKDGEKLKVNNKTVSTGPPDSELCEGGLNSQVSQHQNVSNVESSDGGAVGDKEANTLIDNRESLPLAPDSVDMEVESQLLNTRSSSQQKNSSDVTVIPDTQEMLTDIDNDSCNELAVECPGSPVIPLQNGSKDAGLYNMEDDVVKSTDNEISDSNKVKLSSTGLPLSDMESHQMTSVADGRSTQLTVRQKRKQLLENIIKQKPKYRCSHGSDSTPNAQSKDNVSSLRKRAKLTAEIVSTNSQPCRHPAEGPSDLDSKKSTITKVKSIVGISKSDSEFTNPTTRRLLSLSRRKVGTKPSMANIPVTIDDRVESSGEMCEQTKKPSNKQQSGLPKEECLDIDVSKQKEADSGVSSTNASEVTHSPSVTINKVNAKSQAMSRKTKAKKRGTEDVIKISSCSEPEAFKPPPFKKRKPRPRFSSERMVTPTSTEADRAPSMSAAEQSPVNDSDSETSDYNGLPEQNTTTIEGQGSNKKDAPTITSPRSSEVETDQVKEDDSPEGRVEDSVSVANTKSNGNTSSKQGSLLTKEVWDTTDGDTESSDSSDSDGTDAGKAEQRKGTRPADSDNLDKKDKTSKLNKVTALLDTSSSSFSSSNEEADSVAKPASTRQKTSDKQSSVGHRLDDTSKIEKAKLSLSQKEQEKPVPKKKGAASPKRKAKGVVNPPQHLEQSSSESESADEEGTTQGLKSTVISQQSLKKSGRGRTNEPGKETTHPARTSPKKRLQKNLRSQVSTTRGPPRFLFSRTTTKKNYPQQLSKPVKQTGKAKGSYESENSTESDDDVWSSSEEEDKQPEKKIGSLEMLIPKGQQRTKAKPAAVKPTSMRRISVAPKKRTFSSGTAARMFSLTPSILSKREKNTDNKGKVSKRKSKARESKAGKKVGYKELSLSQQEVLLAKGGSRKLQELLADDKLWGETLS